MGEEWVSDTGLATSEDSDDIPRAVWPISPPPVWSRLASARPGNELRPAFAQALGLSIRTIPMRFGWLYAVSMIKLQAIEPGHVQFVTRVHCHLACPVCRAGPPGPIGPICAPDGGTRSGGAVTGVTRRSWRFSRNKQGHLVRGTVRSLAPRRSGRRSPVRAPGSARPLIW
jgi:hypothetical protein